ncbi:MAG: Hsp20 family protein [Alphaproteobacteria bacterium]|nr:Hsp20 family protein [Alphaproteobacteria bacterium]NCB49535.1 Hsp20 family protein [Alphaproteobacteria bacterium]
MARIGSFTNPLMLGFEELESLALQLSKSPCEGFPPYNIELLSDTQIEITLALAGFKEEDLDITTEGNRLLIQGRVEEKENHQYLYHGIALRKFQRAFLLADGMKVKNAVFENGLLKIDIQKIAPEFKITKIKINQGHILTKKE